MDRLIRESNRDPHRRPRPVERPARPIRGRTTISFAEGLRPPSPWYRDQVSTGAILL
jgi:hypothetical protein